jgi:DNA-binding LacI/PurR family transcriptional regulator
MASGDLRPTQSRRSTVRDVAAQAHVSAQTVSNYINRRFDEMGAETRARIAAVMEELEFHPDSRARGLRTQRARALVFIVIDEGARFLADPMTDLILAGIGDVTRDRGYGLLIQAGTPDVRSADLLAPVFERRADAALLLLSGDPSVRSWYASRLADRGVPCVVFEDDHPAGTVFSVVAANQDGSRRLVSHLIAHGHRRIAFIAARVSWPMIEERHRGYRDALMAADIPLDPSLERFDGVWDLATGAPLVQSLLDQSNPPTAIVCGNDLLALGAMHQLQVRGLKVPDDVAVAGFNDFNFSAFVNPPLTTVRIPGYEIGRIAANRLIGHLEGTLDVATERRVVLPVELVLRASA